MNTNAFKAEINNKKDIEELGFEYVETENGCQGHFFPYVSVKLDLRDNHLELKDIEETLGSIFLTVLQSELKSNGIRKIHSIWWDRFFIIDPGWNVRKFTAYFNVRITNVDNDKSNNNNNNICKL